MGNFCSRRASEAATDNSNDESERAELSELPEHVPNTPNRTQAPLVDFDADMDIAEAQVSILGLPDCILLEIIRYLDFRSQVNLGEGNRRFANLRASTTLKLSDIKVVMNVDDSNEAWLTLVYPPVNDGTAPATPRKTLKRVNVEEMRKAFDRVSLSVREIFIVLERTPDEEMKKALRALLTFKSDTVQITSGPWMRRVSIGADFDKNELFTLARQVETLRITAICEAITVDHLIEIREEMLNDSKLSFFTMTLHNAQVKEFVRKCLGVEIVDEFDPDTELEDPTDRPAVKRTFSTSRTDPLYSARPCVFSSPLYHQQGDLLTEFRSITWQNFLSYYSYISFQRGGEMVEDKHEIIPNHEYTTNINIYCTPRNSRHYVPSPTDDVSHRDLVAQYYNL